MDWPQGDSCADTRSCPLHECPGPEGAAPGTSCCVSLALTLPFPKTQFPRL